MLMTLQPLGGCPVFVVLSTPGKVILAMIPFGFSISSVCDAGRQSTLTGPCGVKVVPEI